MRKARSNIDIGLPDGTTDESYMTVMREQLPKLLDGFSPDLVLYQAGVDPHANDKLGRLALSDDGLMQRDRFVVEQVRQRGLPIASALGGGYGDDQREVAARHARSMLAMADENRRFSAPSPNL